MSSPRRTLYLITPGLRLRRIGASLRVCSPEGLELSALPTPLIDAVVVSSECRVSPRSLQALGRAGIPVIWISRYGRPVARLEPLLSKFSELRRAQYQSVDDGALALRFARAVVAGKLAAARRHLVERAAELSDADPVLLGLREAIRQLEKSAFSLRYADSLSVLQGREGWGARAYWGVFGTLILSNDPAFQFSGRNRRPPRDAVNALLSFLSALLLGAALGAISAAGLDPHFGFLHQRRPGRPALALDFMEEFRTPLVERLALRLINRGQLRPAGFEVRGGGISLTEESRRVVLHEWHRRLLEGVRDPSEDGEPPVGWGEVLTRQAARLARSLRYAADYQPWHRGPGCPGPLRVPRDS